MSKRNLINILFLGSILFIIILTMFPEASLGTGVEQGGTNFVPFYTIGNLLFHHSFAEFIKNNIGNIILFIPFGFMLSFKFNNINGLLKGCLVGMLLSTSIECIQLFMPNRWTDIDDVILNTLGAGLGFVLFKLTNQMCKTYKEIHHAKEDCD